MVGLIGARRLGLAIAGAVIALGAFVATSVGNPFASTSKRVTQGAWTLTRPVAHIAAGGKYVYENATGTVPADHYVSGIVKCPSGHQNPLAPLFDSNSIAVFQSTSVPHLKGQKGWVIGLTNTSSSPANVVVGVVCAQ